VKLIYYCSFILSLIKNSEIKLTNVLSDNKLIKKWMKWCDLIDDGSGFLKRLIIIDFNYGWILNCWTNEENFVELFWNRPLKIALSFW
jgi:hypothetical protein